MWTYICISFRYCFFGIALFAFILLFNSFVRLLFDFTSKYLTNQITDSIGVGFNKYIWFSLSFFLVVFALTRLSGHLYQIGFDYFRIKLEQLFRRVFLYRAYNTEHDKFFDADYMNSRFDKYLKLIRQEGSSEESIEQAKAELHKTFAALTQEAQKYANIFLHDIERGDVIAKTLRDYITEYQFRAKDDQIHRFATIFGLDEDKLRNMMGLNLNEATINEFGRFDELKKSVDKSKAKAFFEAYEQTKLIPPKVNMKTDQVLRQFILTGGFEVDMP